MLVFPHHVHAQYNTNEKEMCHIAMALLSKKVTLPPRPSVSIREVTASAVEESMKKLILSIGLLVLIVQAGFAQKPGPAKWQVGLNGGYLVPGGNSTVNSFGLSLRFGPDGSRFLDDITFNIWHESHNGSTFFSLHVSRLFNMGTSRQGGLFFGPGFSVLLSLPIPIPHLKAAFVIPLNKSIGIELGCIFPILPIALCLNAGFSICL
jgi:hypothetical protein